MHLKELSATLTSISNIFVTNASGKIIHSSVTSLVGFDVSRQDFFQQASKQHKPDTLIITPHLTHAMGDASISLVREITGVHGEFDGVVLAALDPAFDGNLLESIRFTPDTTTALVHGDGKVFVNAPDALLISNAQGTITTANQQVN